ncbi:MAG TPA: DUF4476 domain-containing protein, partial [Chitinophagaceae bacterium]
LQPGQHTLKIVRTNQSRELATTFTLRQGYDLNLMITANGAVSSSEVRNRGTGNATGQLTTAGYNRLYTQTKNKTGSAARASYLESQFNTINRKMTARQASQLIQLVNSESQRLKLAKLSYSKVSDPYNFSLVSNLLNSTANRNELNSFIASADDGEINDGTALSAEQFNTIYNEVLAETNNSDRIYYLNNFFAKEFNFYTSAQAKQLIQSVTGEQDRLTLAKNAYRGVTDKGGYSTVFTLLANATSRSQLATYINNYSGSSSSVAMSTTEFNRLYNNIRNSYSASTKLSLVTSAFTSTANYFTTAQARQLLLQVNAESDRLSLAKNAYGNLVDPENFTQLYDVVSSTGSRNELAAFYSSMQGGYATKSAMSDADFSSLYRDVQFTFGLGAKYSALTTIFNNESNYFTVAQAKQLIQLVSSESNRLELAKLSYGNIVDQSNFSLVYDLFSQANRNELISYVGSSARMQ